MLITILPMSKIEDAHLLEDLFGYFPSFHDAEVLRLILERNGGDGLPTLEAQISAFEITSEVVNGRYVLDKHCIVTLRFFAIDGLVLEDFNHQNALFGLSIKDISSYQLEDLKFEIRFDAAHGMNAHFRCRSVQIKSVTPVSN